MTAIPKVSVLIPSYNYARFLPTAIESVLRQDFTDYELIVSDDASTDGSADLIRALAAREPRIRPRLRSHRAGMVAHWNECLAAARGEYVKFIFADDCLTYRYSLGRLVSHLEDNAGAVLAISARLVLDEQAAPRELWDELKTPGLRRGPEAIARCLWHDKNLLGEPSAALFRRRAGTRGFDPQLRQLVDLEFWFHLLQAGDLYYDAEPICSFRRHPAQQTMQNRGAHVGPVESLRIAARYLDKAAPAWGVRTARFRQMQILHRCLHYSRKRAPRTPEIVAAESSLLARLPWPWHLACWSLHRCAKPFDNLGRYARRVQRRHRPAALPPHLRQWRAPLPPPTTARDGSFRARSGRDAPDAAPSPLASRLPA